MILPHLRSTLRLAFTYLGIIMVLSIGFSAIFYFTSAGSLQLTVKHASSEQPAGPKVGNLDTANDGTTTVTPYASTELDSELATRLGGVQKDLLWRLVFLNIGMLAAGSALSYYLARRTLGPIEQSVAAQARFSADASHEFRTPLAALRARGEVALRDKNLTIVQAKAALKSNVKQAIQLERLADGLLKLSRSDHWPQALGLVVLYGVVARVVRQLQARAEAKHITVKYDITPDLKVIAETDSLVQVVSILLDNAIKYSPEHSSVAIHAKKDGAVAVLTVRDEGVGIRSADLPHIFERFYRADHARRSDDQSYGLGLAIAKQLVDQYRGTISVESEPNKGTTFTVRLPLG